MQSVAHEYIEQGIEQGIGQGIEVKAKEIAKNMIKEGFDVKVIMKITNLSKEAIEALKK